MMTLWVGLNWKQTPYWAETQTACGRKPPEALSFSPQISLPVPTTSLSLSVSRIPIYKNDM